LPEEIAGTKFGGAITLHLEYYRDSPGRFDLDLRLAVVRQSAFVEKMHTLLWIRAPSLPHTLKKALDRYRKFLYLMKVHPGQNLVPTLDVDLVWHTHQLSPPFYNFVTLRDTGRFINHDDRVEATKLDIDFKLCEQLWMDTFGEGYSGCLCWQCEQYSAALSDLAESLPGEATCMEWAPKGFYEKALASGEVTAWSNQLPPAQRRAQALKRLTEQEYAAFVADIRITTKWYRDVELGRLARAKGEHVPCLSRLGLNEVRQAVMKNIGPDQALH
jgi:hypothetical protein